MMEGPSWILRMRGDVKSLGDLQRLCNKHCLNTMLLRPRLFSDFTVNAMVSVRRGYE